MSVEISADTAVVMNFKGQYLAVNVDFILHQGMCSKQGPTLRELCLHFRLRTFR